MVIHVTVSC